MKKIICLVLTLTFILGMVAFADSSEMEMVLRIVKERLSSTEIYDRMDSRTTTGADGRTYYRFYWMSETDENVGELSVTATNSGIITNYYCYKNEEVSDDSLSIHRKTHADVQVAAQAFLEKINPQIVKNLELTPASKVESLREEYYEFNIQRVENGLPVYGDTGYITIAPDGETVESFTLRYTEGLEFGVDELISSEAAKKSYGEKLGLKLYYTLHYNNGKREVVAVYSPNGEYNEYINAVSGQLVTPIEPEYNGENYKLSVEESVMMDSATANGSFTEAEKKELEAVDGLITKEKAAEIVLSSKVLPLFSKDYKAEYFSLSKDYYDTKQYYWNITFEGEEGYADAQVDAVTGRITSFYKNHKYTEEEKIAPEQARKIANTTMTVLAPEFFPADGKSPYVPAAYNGGYTFSWKRHENGIPFEGGNAYITVDSVNGDVVSYYLVHQNLDFPSLEGIISEETALDKMFEQTEYEPYYIKTCKEKGAKFYDSTFAVYMLQDRNIVIKAENGEPLYNNGKSEELIPYTDVSGHFSENAVTILAKYGVGFADGKFLPDEVITQRDLLALLNSVFCRGGAVVLGGELDYNEVYRTAERNKILVKAEHLPDGPVTREMAAVLIIRAMGLEEAAKLSGIYKTPFADVTENVGYVAILTAMGVFKGDENGNFNPTAPLTRGEAAVMLVNYLDR